jgi:Lipoprotein LpqB beta-propeller domain
MSPRRRLAPRAALLLSAVACVVLSGCVRLPTSGPVQFATATPSSSQQLPVLVFPAGPPPNATPEEVAKGFLDAMASYQPGYPVARQFLTARAGESWDTSTVQVYDTSAGNRLRAVGSEVRMSTEAIGGTNSTGVWTSAEPGSKLAVSFPMVKVAGEWRIDRSPTGVLMSGFDFQREYLPLRLFYFDVTFAKLIPDPRYLPVRGVEGALIARLAGGPSAWLSPVVRTAFPTGARTVPPTVRVTGDVAQVRMSDERVSTLNESQKRALFAQVAATMAQLGAPRVQILVGATGAPLTAPSLPADGTVDANLFAGDLRLSPNGVDALYAFVDGRLTPIKPAESTLASRQLAKIPGSSCAVSQSGARLALVDRSGRNLYLAGATTKPPGDPDASGTQLARPSFDRLGGLWLVDTGVTRNPITVISPGKRRVVRVPLLAGRRVTSLRVGPDGVRAALVIDDQGKSQVMLARVERSGPDSGVIALTGLVRYPLALDRVADIGWQEADRLVLLGANGDAPLQPFQLRVDGSQVEAIASAPPATSMTVMPEQPLVIARAGGTLSGYDQAQGWLDLGRGTAPCYPG